MPLRKQKRTLAQLAQWKRSRQDLYSHTRVTIDMTLYRNTQPAHTTALIQGTYYQHVSTIPFAMIAYDMIEKSDRRTLDEIVKYDRKQKFS